MSGAAATVPRARRRTLRPPLWQRAILPGYVLGVLLVTLVPIGVMVLYSFNRAPNERLTFSWQGFTSEWYRRLFEIPDLTSALVTSLEIAALSTVIAVAIGTPARCAWNRMCELDSAPSGIPRTMRDGSRTSSRETSARVVKPGSDSGSSSCAMRNGIQKSTTVARSMPVVSQRSTL